MDINDYNLVSGSEISGRFTPIEMVTEANWAEWRARAGVIPNKWIDSVQFFPKQAEVCLIPDEGGGLDRVLVGVGKEIGLWSIADLPRKLPQGNYNIETELSSVGPSGGVALGWALGSYHFDAYKKENRNAAKLVMENEQSLNEVRRLASSIWLVRDLINTPANDMGPDELATAADEIASAGQASISHIIGEELLTAGYPTIHMVGRASDKEPRLIDLSWGSPESAKVTLVGKGVCFDSGGLDLKPSDNMLLMKKDMGGAAHVLGLAKFIMEAELDVRLRVLIPAVENSVSGSAFHPGDVIKTRSGKTVEIGNTDAEGRLILCDALTEASRESPELVIDIATLTGAARVALGTEMAAMFTDNEELAVELASQSLVQQDPLWRLPLWEGYLDDLESHIADYNNVAPHRYAGAISAGLFLQKFVSDTTAWAHFDIMGWNRKSRPGRPIGGEAFAFRALTGVLVERYGKPEEK